MQVCWGSHSGSGLHMRRRAARHASLRAGCACLGRIACALTQQLRAGRPAQVDGRAAPGRRAGGAGGRAEALPAALERAAGVPGLPAHVPPPSTPPGSERPRDTLHAGRLQVLLCMARHAVASSTLQGTLGRLSAANPLQQACSQQLGP